MKICVLGRANYILLQRRFSYLASIGHDIHIISLQEGAVEGCKMHYIKPLTQSKLDYILRYRQVNNLIKTINPDVVDFHGVSSNGLFSLFIKDFPTVLTVYGPDLYMHIDRFPILKNVVKRVVKNAQSVYGSTPAIKGYIKDYLDMTIGDKLKIKSWGIPFKKISNDADRRRAETRTKYGAKEDTKVFIHSRRLLKFWRIPMLVDAMAKIVAADSNTQLWLVYPPLNPSEEIFKKELETQIASLGIQDNIKFLGGFAYEDFITVNHGADFFVCIGENDLLASTLLEGMATRQIPVLVDLPAYHEIITDKENGFFVKDLSADNVAKTCINILNDFETVRDRVVPQNISLLAQDYDEEVCSEWLLEMYQEAADQYRKTANV